MRMEMLIDMTSEGLWCCNINVFTFCTYMAYALRSPIMFHFKYTNMYIVSQPQLPSVGMVWFGSVWVQFVFKQV